jgi:DNA-binding SARP family transcriptional activator
MDRVRYDVELLGGFVLRRDGAPQDVPPAGRRCVALLALGHRRLRRREALACALRPDAASPQALGSLRSVLWRLSRSQPGLLAVGADTVRLRPEVDVDVDLLAALLEDDPRVAPVLALDALPDADLLPDWDEEWLEPERERVRQRWLHALDVLARRLCREGRHGAAVETALRVLAADPLRESAHRLVIDLHLAEGNTVEAGRQLARCRRLLGDALGVEPGLTLPEVASASRARAIGPRPAAPRQGGA